MADIFISYSKSRRSETSELAADLERAGFTVWWDKDITPGEPFRDSINAELAIARAAIVIWTPPAVKSNWVISEVTRAERRDILIPVHSADLVLDNIPAPFDVLHTVPLENRDAVFAALARKGVTPSGAPSSPAERPIAPAPPKPIASRRAMLLGGGSALAAATVAGAMLIRPQENREFPEPGRPIHTFGNPDQLYVSAVAFTADGRRAISASWDQRLRLWDLARREQVRQFEGHEGPVWSVALLPDGAHAISASADQTLRLWDLSKSRPIATFDEHDEEVWSVAVLPDGKRALSGSKDRTVKLWDIATRKSIWTLPADMPVRAVGIADAGRVGLAVGRGPMLSWTLESGAKLRSFEGHQGETNSLAVAPDGMTVISGADDATIRVWQLSSERERRKLSDGTTSKILSVAIAPSGRTALSGSADGVARLWELTAGRLLRTFKGHNDTVDAVAIAPDGRSALTASRDKTLKLWDLQGTGSEV